MRWLLLATEGGEEKGDREDREEREEVGIKREEEDQCADPVPPDIAL
jgi:hypothetical protein